MRGWDQWFWEDASLNKLQKQPEQLLVWANILQRSQRQQNESQHEELMMPNV